MSSYRKLVLFLIFLMAFGCGKKASVTRTTLTLGAINLSQNGDVYVTAKNMDLNQFQSFIITSDTDTFDIPNGNWIFHGYHWDGGGALAGNFFCGSQTMALIGGDAIVDLNLTQANCLLPQFTDATATDLSLVQTIDVTHCNDLSTVIGGSVNCDTHPSYGKSFRVIIPEIIVSDPNQPAISTGKFIASPCYAISAGVSRNSLTLRIPSGNANMPFPFLIRSFDQVSCTGVIQDTKFPRGLLSLNTTERKVIDDTTPTPDVTSIYVKFFPAGGTELSLNPASVNIPAETIYNFDLSKFVTGGIGTITYSLSSGTGSLTGSVYTPSGSPETAIINVSDDTGLIIPLTLVSYSAILQDFTTSTSYGWASTRSSVGNNLIAANTISQSAANAVRLAKDPSDSLIGILSEGPSTNICTRSDVLNTTPWSIPAGALTITNPSMTLSSISNEASLNDTDTVNTNSSYIFGTTTPTSPGLDYTFSVFLKAGTSNIANVYLQDAGSSCVCLVVDLSTGASTNCSFCGGGTSGVIPYPNGWYQVWMKENRAGSGIYPRIYPAWNSALSPSLNMLSTGNILAWGAQLENSSSPSSPIVTTGTAVTRTADSLSESTFAATINKNQGTFLLFWNNQLDATPGSLLNFIFNASPTDAGIRFHKDGAGRVVATITRDGAATDVVTSGINLLDGNNKYLFSYDATSMLSLLNDNTQVYNGIRSSVSTNSYDKAWLGSTDGVNDPSKLIMKKIYYWSVNFSDVVLKQMIP
ncbi:MAG: hypothetical protein CO099_00225 [Bdellovibrio sp. CG_4_9_14_3_um_filter_39_7]|nr:MAG: hypothetical protein CO099_00225 [Bdellovibrio sp. CG_4_9_14_3_um_filter_39_7]